MDKFRILEKEIEKIVAKSYVVTDFAHSKSARKWVLKLKPDASKELQIAALAHDLERGLNHKRERELSKGYARHKEEHAKRSANDVEELLKKHSFDKKFIKKVRNLVLLHEVGGNKDADVVRDADSLSFFETNLIDYFRRNTKEQTIFKIKYMYDRMSRKAKKLAQKFRYKNPKLNATFREAIKQSSNS